MNKNKHLIESLITDINDRLQNHTMTLEQANLLESQKKLLQNLLISVIHKDDMDINDLNIIEDISNELLDNDCESEVFKKIPDEIKLKQKDYVIVECKSCLHSILDEISFLNSVNFELNDDSKKLLIQCFEDYLFLSNNFLDVIYDNVLYFARIDKAKSIFNKYLNYQTDYKIDSKHLNHDELKAVVEKAKEQYPVYAAQIKDKEEKEKEFKKNQNAFDHKIRIIEQKDLKPSMDFDYGPRLDSESKNENKPKLSYAEKVAKQIKEDQEGARRHRISHIARSYNQWLTFLKDKLNKFNREKSSDPIAVKEQLISDIRVVEQAIEYVKQEKELTDEMRVVLSKVRQESSKRHKQNIENQRIINESAKKHSELINEEDCDDFDYCKMESLIFDFDNENYDLEIQGANSQLGWKFSQ
jgi:hypothetical protein